MRTWAIRSFRRLSSEKHFEIWNFQHCLSREAKGQHFSLGIGSPLRPSHV